MKTLKLFLKHLLGGRPMHLVENLFWDTVAGVVVRHYVDTLGRHWMATGMWSWLRVPKA